MSDETVFAQAVVIADPAARAAFLDRACAGNPDLRRDVDGLLAAHFAPDTFLRSSVRDQAPTAAFAANGTGARPGIEERVGTVVAGRYKLVEVIGEGGMGAVFMAQQTEPVKRLVAVKVIKAGMDSKTVLARFEAERQALAMMDHPNIAKVLDAGMTETGRPFFVMELVKGVPITKFCDDRKLTPRQRLELFFPVCQAIQHAHQKGVIHRDVKPNNVLVAMYDDRPVPKVIDFGVAKAAGPQLTDHTLVTGFGAVVGTPEYMSPEQASFNQMDVDTRSDVYSLGVLLYELLTGTTPIDRKSLGNAAVLEVLRIVREKEPPRPSTRLSTDAALPTIAASRNVEPAKLSKLMKGELDWIVMKALEKDRARRYDTANSLAKDVQRYLADESVEACPPSVGYRLWKTYRKNRPAVLVGGAFAALLVLGYVATSYGLYRAEREAERANAAERNAVENALKATDAAEAEKAAKVDALAKEAETKTALADLRRAQTEQRADQYAWDMQVIPTALAAGNVAQVQQLLDRHRTDRRGIEWHYWDRKIHGERREFSLYGKDGANAVPRFQFTANGTRLVVLHVPVARANNRWDGSPQVSLRTTGDYELKVWDTGLEKVVASYPLPVDKAEQGRTTVSNPWISRDGTHVAIAWGRSTYGGGQKRVQVLTVVGARPVIDFQDAKLAIRSTAFSPDGRRFAVVLAPDNLNFGGPNVLPGDPAASRDAATIKVWDAETGAELATIDRCAIGPFVQDGVAFSADGSKFATVQYPPSADGGTPAPVVVVYESATGKEWRRLHGAGNNPVLAFDPKGTRLAAVEFSAEGPKVTAWDLATEKFEYRRPVAGVDKGNAARPIFSPDGSRLAVQADRVSLIVEASTKVAVLDAATGNPLAAVDGSRVKSQFSPDGTRLVTIKGNALNVWDAATGRLLHTLTGHSELIEGFTFSEDGRRLYSVDQRGAFKEWDAVPAEPLSLKVNAVDLAGAARFPLSPDGRWAAELGQTDRTVASSPVVAALWDLADGRSYPLPLRHREKDPSGRLVSSNFAFSPNGRWLGLVRWSQITPFGGISQGVSPPPVDMPPADLTMWDTTDRREVAFLKLPGVAAGLFAINPDGTQALAAVATKLREGRRGMNPAGPGRLGLYDLKTGREVWSLDTSAGWAVFSPDGKRIAYVELTPNRSTLTVLDAADKRVLLAAPIEGRTAVGVATGLAPVWSPDGTRILTYPPVPASIGQPLEPQLIRVFDAATGKEGLTIHAPTGVRVENITVVFSPDGRRIAARLTGLTPAGRRQILKIWDADAGRELLSQTDDAGVAPNQAGRFSGRPAFTADGHRIVYLDTSGRGTFESGARVKVMVWDATPRPEAKE